MDCLICPCDLSIKFLWGLGQRWKELDEVQDQGDQGNLRDTLESAMEQHRVGMGFVRESVWVNGPTAEKLEVLSL